MMKSKKYYLIASLGAAVTWLGGCGNSLPTNDALTKLVYEQWKTTPCASVSEVSISGVKLLKQNDNGDLYKFHADFIITLKRDIPGVSAPANLSDSPNKIILETHERSNEWDKRSALLMSGSGGECGNKGEQAMGTNYAGWEITADNIPPINRNGPTHAIPVGTKLHVNGDFTAMKINNVGLIFVP